MGKLKIELLECLESVVLRENEDIVGFGRLPLPGFSRVKSFFFLFCALSLILILSLGSSLYGRLQFRRKLRFSLVDLVGKIEHL